MNSNFPLVNIMGINVNICTQNQAVDEVFKFFSEKSLHIVHTINPEFILTAQEDKLYAEILNGAALAVPDGIGVIKAAKFQGVSMPERVGGCDLTLKILERMQNSNFSVYFLGASQQRLDKALYNLKQKFPNLKIAGSHNGYFKDDDDEMIIEDINNSNADFLVIGLGGIKKQETWIWKYKDRLNVKVSIGVGGSIDVYSGEIKRAPKWCQKLNLEWLYRTLQEPKKRLKRVYRLPYFLYLAFKDSKIKNKSQK